MSYTDVDDKIKRDNLLFNLTDFKVPVKIEPESPAYFLKKNPLHRHNW